MKCRTEVSKFDCIDYALMKVNNLPDNFDLKVNSRGSSTQQELCRSSDEVVMTNHSDETCRITVTVDHLSG